MGADRCLVCYSFAGERQITSSGYALDKQLSAVFVLKVLFRVPTETLEKYLEMGAGDGPESWIRICGECEIMVGRAKETFAEIVAASKRFKAVQGQVMEKVRDSCRTSCGGLYRHGDDDNDWHEKYVEGGQNIWTIVTDESRQFATEYNYGCLRDPFTDGDKLAARWLHHMENTSVMTDDDDAGVDCSTLDDTSSAQNWEEESELTEESPQHEDSNEFPLSDSNDRDPPEVMEEEGKNPKTPNGRTVTRIREYAPRSGRTVADSQVTNVKLTTANDAVVEPGAYSKENGKQVKTVAFPLPCSSIMEHPVPKQGVERVEGQVSRRKSRVQKNVKHCTLWKHARDVPGAFSREDGKLFFRCTFDNCGAVYERLRVFMEHKSEHFGGKFPCDQCGKKLSSFSGLYRHLRYSQSRHNCPHCDLVATTKASLVKHINVIHEKVYPLHCATCGMGLRYKLELKEHQVVTHGHCSVVDCRAAFPGDLEKLWDHQMTDHGKEIDVYVCEACGKLFGRKWLLREHLRVHDLAKRCAVERDAFVRDDGTLAYRCPVESCIVEYEMLLPFLAHKSSHLGVKHCCEHCDMEFSHEPLLRLHNERVHGNVSDGMGELLSQHWIRPKIKCPHCEKLIGEKYWGRHIREVHEKVYPFYCETCGIGQSNRWQLRQHRAIKHGLCSVKDCKVEFPGHLEELRVHQLEIHGREVDVKACGQCGKLFLRNYKLRKHLELHQKQKK